MNLILPDEALPYFKMQRTATHDTNEALDIIAADIEEIAPYLVGDTVLDPFLG